jgi:serine/threonine protein phosphatase PrpC
MSLNSFIIRSVIHSMVDTIQTIQNTNIANHLFSNYKNILNKNKKNIPYIDSASIPLGKNQDFCTFGKGITKYSNEPFSWIVVCDGHGVDANGDCVSIDYMKQLDWDFYLSNYTSNVVDMINIGMYIKRPDLLTAYNCGTTLSLARIFNNRCELWNVGDSHTLLFIDNQISYINTPHTYENPKERIRLKGVIDDAVYTWTTNVINDNSIIMEKRIGICFKHPFFQNEYISIVPTMCIGHGQLTGLEPEYNVVHFDNEKQHVRVVVFSDGFGDMNVISCDKDLRDLNTMNATQLAKKAERRWKQTWRVLKNKDDLHLYDLNSFPPSEYDDISVAVWDNDMQI